MSHPDAAAAPPAGADGGAETPTTTIMIGRAQRRDIEDIRRALTAQRGRGVATQEAVAIIVDYYKENHP